MGFMMVLSFALYTMLEAHFISVYLGRNYALFLTGAYWSRFITEVYNYWKYYYSLQQSTLYNFLETRNISEDFDKLIQN